MRKSSLPFFPLCHPSYVWLNDSRDIPALNNQTFARCYSLDVYLICFSQNFIALSIQPSATVPCPSSKPCSKPRKTSICASVPFALIAFMRRFCGERRLHSLNLGRRFVLSNGKSAVSKILNAKQEEVTESLYYTLCINATYNL